MEVIQQMLWKQRIILAPRWPWNLTVILVRKETDHTNFVMDIFLRITPVPIS